MTISNFLQSLSMGGAAAAASSQPPPPTAAALTEMYEGVLAEHAAAALCPPDSARGSARGGRS